MGVLLSTYGLRGNVAFIAARFDGDASTAEGCDVRMLRGVMPVGVWR